MSRLLRSFGEDCDLRLSKEVLPFASRFVFDLFEVDFGKTPSRGIGRLVVRFTTDRALHLQSEDLVDVLVVHYYFDEAAFSRLELAGKKQYFLDSIWHSLDAYADQYGWDRAYCRSVYERILAGGIVFDRWWGKPVRHKPSGKSVQGHVWFFDSILLTLGVFDRRKSLLIKFPVVVLPGTIGAVDAAFGKLEWLDADRVRLWHSNARDYWDCDVNTGQVDFHYPRAERGDPHGEFDLGRMYLEGDLVPRDRRQAIHWLQRSAAKGFQRADEWLARLAASDKS